MTHQTSFSQAEFADKKKITRREKFLARMEEIIPWPVLLAVIEPFYPKGERGRPPIGLERMLRVYFLQQWYGLADEALEDALYDSQALRAFARIDLAADGVPDATTLLKFRRLLETNDLCKGLFTAINADLTARGLLLREGTLVDATLLAAPPGELSEQEKKVLTLLAWGHTQKEIAGRLKLSVKTVDTYKVRVLKKLSLSSRSEMVRYALRRGWLHEERLSPNG